MSEWRADLLDFPGLVMPREIRKRDNEMMLSEGTLAAGTAEPRPVRVSVFTDDAGELVLHVYEAPESEEDLAGKKVFTMTLDSEVIQYLDTILDSADPVWQLGS